MRAKFLIGILAAGLALPSAAAAQKVPEVIQTSEVTVGDISFVKLPGNPDLGYKWRVNRERSRGLDRVKVEKIGWLKAPQERALFAEARSRLNVLLTGKSAGQADVAFDYYRSFGGRIISRTSIVRVTVKPKAENQ